jgi:hypothetical protein
MKVKIGPYINWFGPYQLAELLCFWTKSKNEYGLNKYPDWVHNFGSNMADTWIEDFLQWVNSKRNRKIKIQIDKYDTWGMDHTLAMIIVPMLKQLRDTAHGYPANFDYEDQNYGPQYQFKGEGWEFPDDGFERWKATIDEIIWAFEQVIDEEWELQYHNNGLELPDSWTWDIDWIGIRQHQARIDNGLKLFGKYYENLWD